jgi:hypothetical protein
MNYQPRQQVEVNGYLHAPVALSPGNCDAGMTQDPVSVPFSTDICADSASSPLTKKCLLQFVGAYVQARGLRGVCRSRWQLQLSSQVFQGVVTDPNERTSTSRTAGQARSAGIAHAVATRAHRDGRRHVLQAHRTLQGIL